MTHQFQSNTTHEAVQLLAEHGFEAMAQAIQVLMNEAMRIERAHYLQADPYQRSAGRRSHANGFKPKTFSSRLGKLQLQIPQTRDSQFYPSTLERGERSEKTLKLALTKNACPRRLTLESCCDYQGALRTGRLQCSGQSSRQVAR